MLQNKVFLFFVLFSTSGSIFQRIASVAIIDFSGDAIRRGKRFPGAASLSGFPG